MLWRRSRLLALVAVYSAIFAVSIGLAYGIRYDFRMPPEVMREMWGFLVVSIFLKCAWMALFGQFRCLLSFFAIPDVFRIGAAMGMVAAFFYVGWALSEGGLAPPRGVLLMDFMFSTAGLMSFRLALRFERERKVARSAAVGNARRVALVGAGEVGASLASQLLAKRALLLRPILFLDDDPGKWSKSIYGIPVIGPIERLPEAVSEYAIDQVIIAMPSAPATRVRRVIELAREAQVAIEIIPSYMQLATGEVRAERRRPVDLEDLLGREPVQLDGESIRAMVAGRRVLVTGAGGSIGGELCRQIAANGPAQLLLIEQSEPQLFEVEQDLIEGGRGALIVPLVADVLDEPRMQGIFRDYRPELVFHAAAHKHVPLMEAQPAEALKNNSFATYRLARIASEAAVERFVLISTDKAINPTNVMGASKRLAEIGLLSLQNSPQNRTRFMAVRFGNVLGSSGSVIPTFKRQIAKGGPVTVTHPDVSRFFMTIPEAVGLVLQAATQGEGGEIFVLDMGQPLKIVEVARQLIRLSGLTPDVDIAIQFTGLRPGEKLFEEVQHVSETLAETGHPRVLRLRAAPPPEELARDCFAELSGAFGSISSCELKRLMQKFVPEYSPWFAPDSASPDSLNQPKAAEPAPELAGA
jgi:FlaA1/EpsC-like NDP-sugar epimerase